MDILWLTCVRSVTRFRYAAPDPLLTNLGWWQYQCSERIQCVSQRVLECTCVMFLARVPYLKGTIQSSIIILLNTQFGINLFIEHEEHAGLLQCFSSLFESTQQCANNKSIGTWLGFEPTTLESEVGFTCFYTTSALNRRNNSYYGFRLPTGYLIINQHRLLELRPRRGARGGRLVFELAFYLV